MYNKYLKLTSSLKIAGVSNRPIHYITSLIPGPLAFLCTTLKSWAGCVRLPFLCSSVYLLWISIVGSANPSINDDSVTDQMFFMLRCSFIPMFFNEKNWEGLVDLLMLCLHICHHFLQTVSWKFNGGRYIIITSPNGLGLPNCDHPWQNQPYCADNHFWVKATIANYNLWTAAPANLKSLAQVLVAI